LREEGMRARAGGRRAGAGDVMEGVER
jgi:hypothetical protein